MIRKAKILIVGAGGLGCPAALYLAAAGVGTLGLVDPDRVSLSNLQRQILYSTAQVDLSKVDSAKGRLIELNPEIEVICHEMALNASNALKILHGYDLVIDGSDNFSTKYLINDAAAKLGIPAVFGTISRFEGQVAIFHGRRSACYRCVYPKPPRVAVANCAEAGVLGAIAGVVGSMQAVQAIEWLIEEQLPGRFETLEGKFLSCDLARAEFRRMEIRRRPGCATCSVEPESIRLADLPGTCVSNDLPEVDWTEALRLLAKKTATLLDVRESDEWDAGHVAGAEHLPLSELREGRAEVVRPFLDRQLLIYCRGGIRSREAATILSKIPGTSARSVFGGLDALAARLDREAVHFENKDQGSV